MHSTALINSLKKIIKHPYKVDGMRSYNDSSAMVQFSNTAIKDDPLLQIYVQLIPDGKNRNRFYIEFDDPLMLLRFNDIFNNKVDFVKIAQDIYHQFNFVYTYVLGKKINYNGYPYSLKDMIEYYDPSHSQSSSSYIFKTVVTEENGHEPLSYMFILSYDTQEHLFNVEFDFSMNILNPDIKSYFIESSQFNKVLDILINDYACKSLEKERSALLLNDYKILHIINYN